MDTFKTKPLSHLSQGTASIPEIPNLAPTYDHPDKYLLRGGHPPDNTPQEPTSDCLSDSLQGDLASPQNERAPPQPDLASDMLHGAAAIARFIGVSQRKAFYLCEKNQIPAFQMGRKWYARRSTLQQFVAEQERRALERVNAA